jgi:beta-lactamase regulating signal transducer with metallopeptidase domain
MSSIDGLNMAAGALLATVLNSFVYALLIGATAWAFIKFGRGVNAATRHVISWGVLVAVLSIPAAHFISIPAGAPAPPVTSAAAQIDEPGATPSPSIHMASPGPADADTAIHFPFEFNAGYFPLFLAAVWGVVCVAQLGRVTWSYAYLNRLKRESVPAKPDVRLSFDEWKLACGVDRDVRLLVSESVASPLAAGFSHPAVIMPSAMMEKLPTTDLDHVVLHELAHLARRDDWTNLVARIASAFVGMHPVAAWILRRIDTEREVACDDWVVSMTGEAKPYAASLARLVEYRLSHRREMLATGIGGRRSELAGRIERLVKGSGGFDARTSLLRVGLSAAVFLMVVVAAVQGPQWIAFAQDEAPPVPPPAQVAPIAPPAPTPVVAVVPPAPGIPAPHPAAPFSWAPPAPAVPVIHDVVEVAPVEYAFAPPPPAPPQRGSQSPPPPPPPDPARAGSSSKSFLAALAEAGYNDLSVDDVIELKNQGITAPYLAAMNKAGWGKLTIRQLTDLRNHGVTAEYLQALTNVGIKNLTLTDVMDLRNHGVRPEMVREIHALGFGPYGVRQIIDFANHGTSPDFFRALKDAGFGQAEPREIIDARNQGVNASALREAKKYGSNLTLRQIIRLKLAGVI